MDENQEQGVGVSSGGDRTGFDSNPLGLLHKIVLQGQGHGFSSIGSP